MPDGHPLNDPSIDNTDDLYRRIKPNQYDHEKKEPIPETFMPRECDEGNISVYAAKLTNVRKVMHYVSKDPQGHKNKNFRKWKLGKLKARIPRQEGLFVRMKPSHDPSHAQIGGERLTDATNGLPIRRRLAQACTIIEWHDDYDRGNPD